MGLLVRAVLLALQGRGPVGVPGGERVQPHGAQALVAGLGHHVAAELVGAGRVPHAEVGQHRRDLGEAPAHAVLGQPGGRRRVRVGGGHLAGGPGPLLGGGQVALAAGLQDRQRERVSSHLAHSPLYLTQECR